MESKQKLGFNNGGQNAAWGNEKTASQIIIDLQDKSIKLRLGLGKLLKMCDDTRMQKESEAWSQEIEFAKQMFTETDPNNK